MPRNTFLFDNAIHLLPYIEAGSGITRAISERHDVIFTNDEKTSEFLITIPRDESNEVEKKSNQVGNQVEKKVTKSVTKSREKVTKFQTSIQRAAASGQWLYFSNRRHCIMPQRGL